MKRAMVFLLVWILCVMLVQPVPLGPPVPLEHEEIPLAINGIEYISTSSTYPLFKYNTVTYIPLTYEVTQALGIQLNYEQGKLELTTSGEGRQVVPSNDVAQLDQRPEATIGDVEVIINYETYLANDRKPILKYRDIYYIPLIRELTYDKLHLDFTYTWDKGIELHNRTIDPEVHAVAVATDKALSEFVIRPHDHNVSLGHDEEIEAIWDRLERIPIDFIEELNDKDVELILTYDPITSLSEYAHLKGVVPRGWESTGRTWDDVPGIGGDPIAVRIGYSFDASAHGSVNLELHEVAHGIDIYTLSTVSDEADFMAIWKEEAPIMFSDAPYMVDYPIEYFAECFAYYYLNEETNLLLKEKAPKTWHFIKDLQADDY